MNHKDLDAWKISFQICKTVYKLCGYFPKEEMYGLTSQIKRSCVSIPSNIAEGAARESDKEFIRFLYIALGSSAELETQLLLAKDLDYFNNEAIFKELKKCQKIIMGLINYLKNKKRVLKNDL